MVQSNVHHRRRASIDRGRHERTPKLPAEGCLNVDLMDFFRLLKDRDCFSTEMYLDVVEAGFEIVRGQGWVTCGWFSCEAEER